MLELEPITREEKFLNGEVGMTPITREEKILAGEDIETVTRREYFLKKYRGGGGDITVEEITITENGTTTAPSGKAYSPIHTNVPQPTLTKLTATENGDYTAPSGTAYNEVEVNVPLPQNAYLLKSVTTPTPIASFSDGEEMVMPSLKVAIEPQQDLHGYDAPWVGGAGKNKLENIFSGTAWAIVGNDGSITLNGTITSVNWLAINENVTLKAGTYTLSGTPSNAPSGLYVYDDGTFGNWSDQSGTGASKTFSEDTTGKILLRVPAGTYNNLKIYPMIESGSSKTTFAPYSNECPISGWDDVDLTVADDVENPTVSNVYTIDLDGTRYGGEVDVVSGTMTVDRAMIDLSTVSFTYNSSNKRWSKQFSDMKNYSARSADLMFEQYEATVSAYTGDTGTAFAYGNDICIYDANQSLTISGKCVYELATPLTIQLTPTAIKSLRGVNNVYANTGDIKDAEYFSKEV